MSHDDDARPRRVQIAAAAAAGLLVYLLVHQLTGDPFAASTLGFAAAQLAAELAAPDDDDPPDAGAPARELVPAR